MPPVPSFPLISRPQTVPLTSDNKTSAFGEALGASHANACVHSGYFRSLSKLQKCWGLKPPRDACDLRRKLPTRSAQECLCCIPARDAAGTGGPTLVPHQGLLEVTRVVCVMHLWWHICCLFAEVVKYLFWYQLSISTAKKFLSVLSELSSDALTVLDKAKLPPGMKACSFWPIYTDSWQFQATNLPPITTSLKQLYTIQSTNPEHSASPNGPIHSVPKNTHWPQTSSALTPRQSDRCGRGDSQNTNHLLSGSQLGFGAPKPPPSPSAGTPCYPPGPPCLRASAPPCRQMGALAEDSHVCALIMSRAAFPDESSKASISTRSTSPRLKRFAINNPVCS